MKKMLIVIVVVLCVLGFVGGTCLFVQADAPQWSNKPIESLGGGMYKQEIGYMMIEFE